MAGPDWLFCIRAPGGKGFPAKKTLPPSPPVPLPFATSACRPRDSSSAPAEAPTTAAQTLPSQTDPLRRLRPAPLARTKSRPAPDHRGITRARLPTTQESLPPRSSASATPSTRSR
ncbi:hypothetical protein DAI22_04g287000 [Oryza sativa Japonica Group]|nr:hypothetical protein DAI22_04g287000 [Oryza sativa Japonica Group]